MTRDEAIKILVDVVFPGEQLEGDNRRKSSNLVDAWAKLGMLKLDEPETADERATRKAIEAIDKQGWSRAVLNVFDAAGLKIVEK